MSFKEVPLGHQTFAAWEGLPWLNTEKSVDGELYIGVGGILRTAYAEIKSEIKSLGCRGREGVWEGKIETGSVLVKSQTACPSVWNPREGLNPYGRKEPHRPF